MLARLSETNHMSKNGDQRLEQLGYKVEATTSPIEALELFRLRPEQFDLIITDMTMPLLTSDKLIKETLNIRSDIPIILCTGFNEKIDEKKAKAVGAVEYLEKSFYQKNLAFNARSVLDAKRAQHSMGVSTQPYK